MKQTAIGKSDIGRVRKKNQDAWGLFPDRGLYIVADGMGGRAAGEVASQMTVDLLRDFSPMPERNISRNPEKWLHEAICHANKKVYEASLADLRLHGMGTTVVALWSDPFFSHENYLGKEVWIGFAGDSRVYRYRNGVLAQITQDHSVVNEYIRMGALTPEAARTHPYKNVISRGVGVAATVIPEILKESVQEGDLFLLCTDGLSNMLDHQEIAAILTGAPGRLEEAASALIEAAKAKGGRDNITVVLVLFYES